MLNTKKLSFIEFLQESKMEGWDSFIETNPELKAAVELISEIEAKTGEQALLVGGCVRDMLMGKNLTIFSRGSMSGR